MRALRIIYLWKLYNLFKLLDLRTGAVSSVWALWKYLQKAGPCQPVMKQHLSIYFIYLFNIYSILQCLKTRRKNSYWFAKHFFGIKRLAILVSHCPHHLPVYAGLKIWKGGVHAVKIMTHYQYKFLGVIPILGNLRRKNKAHAISVFFFFFLERNRNFFWPTTSYVATWPWHYVTNHAMIWLWKLTKRHNFSWLDRLLPSTI